MVSTGNTKSESDVLHSAGLNSTLALVEIIVPFALYIMCALKVSYTRKMIDRDEKGKVIRMRNMDFAYCGRYVAAPIAAMCSGFIQHVASGGSS